MGEISDFLKALGLFIAAASLFLLTLVVLVLFVPPPVWDGVQARRRSDRSEGLHLTDGYNVLVTSYLAFKSIPPLVLLTSNLSPGLKPKASQPWVDSALTVTVPAASCGSFCGTSGD